MFISMTTKFTNSKIPDQGVLNLYVLCPKEVKGDMKLKAVIFDLFGTLVNNFSIEAHKAVLSKMASLVCAESDAFIQSWFNTFHMRCIGTFQSVEDNIIYVCDGLNIHLMKNRLGKPPKSGSSLLENLWFPR